MKNFNLKVYQKLAFLTLMLSFSMPAMASNFTALPADLTIFFGLPTLLIAIIVLFFLGNYELTKAKKIFGFITIGLTVLINAPLVFIDSWSGYKIAMSISQTGECFYETELGLCKGILWFYGFYSVLIMVFMYAVYRFIKKCYPPKLPLLKDRNNDI